MPNRTPVRLPTYREASVFKRKLNRFIAVLVSVFLFGGGITNVSTTAEEPNPGDISYAYAGQLDLRLLEEYIQIAESEQFDVADLNGQEQSWGYGSMAPQDPDLHEIQVEALELLNLDLGQLPIPLVGDGALLEFALGEAQVGALHEYANAKSATDARAAVGLVADQGGLELTRPGEGMNANVDLLSLLKLGDTDILSSVIDQAAVELGALSALAEKPDGFTLQSCDAALYSGPVSYDALYNSELQGNYDILHPELELSREDDNKFCSSYQIADAKVNIHAPVLTGLMEDLETVFDGLETTINGVVSDAGILDTLLGLLGGLTELLGEEPKLTVTVPQGLFETLVDTPLEDENGYVTINLRTGDIVVNLEKIHGLNPDTGLNGLEPNTPLLSTTQIGEVLSAIDSLLGIPDPGMEPNPHGLMAKIEDVLKGTESEGQKRNGLYASEVNLSLNLFQKGILLPDLVGGIEISSRLGVLLDPSSTRADNKGDWEANLDTTYYVETSGAILGLLELLNLGVPTIVGALKTTGGLIDSLLFTSSTGLLSNIATTTGPLINTVFGLLDPLLAQVVQPIANLIVNRQSVEVTDEGNLFRVAALEVNVLKVFPGEAVLKLPIASAAVMAQSFEQASLEVGKLVQEDSELNPNADSFELSYECTYPTGPTEPVDRFSMAYGHNSGIMGALSGTRSVSAGSENYQVIEDLPAGANCEISETGLPTTDPEYKWTLQGWVTDRLSDGQTVADAGDTYTVQLEADTPIINTGRKFVGAVNAYESALVALNLNVATIGNGRALAQDGFLYEVVCSAEGWDLNQSVTYSYSSVGDSYTFNADNPALSLENATVPSSAIQVVPGAKCSVEATGNAVAAKAALAPTGDTKSRTPYTYFLDAEGTAEPYVRVSGETAAEQDTQMFSTGVSVDATSGLVEVAPPADGIGDEWMSQTFHFTVPDAEALDPSGYDVNIVHAYDIDTQDVVIKKLVDGSDETNFVFQYSTGGNDWSDLPAIAEEKQTISVPVVNSELESYSLKIREALGSGKNGPEVSWVLNGDPDIALSAEYAGSFSKAEIEISPVSDAATIPTPPLNVDVKNSYASIVLDKTIDGLSAADIFDTTLIPYENQTMTIRYKVTNTGPIEDFSSIKIYDASLNDSRFALPDGMVINAETGELTGCEDVTFNEDGEAECVVMVTFEDATAAFHYEADDAGATAIALKSINGRADIKARGSDNHGALRLPNFAGMLPATGVTTLVWTLGLGLLIAIGSVVYFVRSRRD